MKKLVFLLAVGIAVAGCSNSQTESNTIEKRDSSVIKDTTAPTETNTVTPPASNGQF